jgi:DNA mismatch endonuclease (patch repair protein)
MDRVSQIERSRVMARVRSSGNASTELKVAAALKEARINKWVSHSRDIDGRPDFALPRSKIAIFVDGCFWHGCPSCYRQPKSSRAYWKQKVKRNAARDARVARRLRRKGWSVFRIWEHSLRDKRDVVRRIKSAMRRRRFKHSKSQFAST